MEQSIRVQALSGSPTQERSHLGLWRLRLALGGTILFAALVGLFAVSWDIQWHTAVGRDRTLTAPHLFILGSVTVMGMTALAAVLIETLWARRNPPVAKSGTRFAGFFSSSFGAYLVGYGALDAAIAFPIDQYWHTLYGIDVAIWAPFHIMAITGFCVCCLGVGYMLASGAHLAMQGGAKGAARAGYMGVIVALATLIGMLSFLLMDSLSTGYIRLGSLSFTVYPLMFGAFGTFVLVVAIRAVPWRMVATSVAAVYLLFGLLNSVLIPALMTLLLGIEQQHLLPGAPSASIVAAQWQYSLLIVAVLLDSVPWVAQRKGWSLKRTNGVTLSAALIGISVAALGYPSFLASAQRASVVGSIAQEHRAVLTTAQASAYQPQVSVVLIIIALSLLLGFLGTYVGNWFGVGIGEAMSRKEQS
jgi:hypothetical protein